MGWNYSHAEFNWKILKHNNEFHGEGVWVLIYCDKLRAHVAADVKQIFGENKLLICFLPQ